MKRVTLREIAEHLGVSVATVSHAVNGRRDISPAMKEKVGQAMRELGYVSDSRASSLRSGKSHVIAVIVSDVSNPHIAYQVKRIEAVTREKGYSAIILNTNEDSKIERKAILTATEQRVDGILICTAKSNSENVKHLASLGIPFVLIGRESNDPTVDYVCLDDFRAGILAGHYLADCGAKNAIYIGPERLETSGLREGGIRKGLCEKIAGASLSLFDCPPTGGAAAVIERLLLAHTTFDGIAVFSDYLAFDVLDLLRRKEKDYPIISFDAVQKHLPLPFSFASVGMLADSWAKDAIDILFRKIETDAPGAVSQIVLEPVLFRF